MTNGTSWQEEQKNLIGTGEGEVPLAEKPPLNTEVQTMASDLKSLQESGGTIPKPYTPQPLNQTTVSDQKKDQIFNPSLLNETPPPQPPKTQTPITAPPPPKLPKKNIFKILLIAILIIGIGALIYFFAYPALSSIFKPSPTPSLENQNNALSNLTPPELQTPNETATTSLTTTSLEENNQIPAQAPLPLNLATTTHTSFFQTPAANIYNIILQAPTLEALRQNTSSTIPTDSISSFLGEIVYKNQNEEILALKGVIQLIAPNFFNNEFLNNFQEDAAFFFYNNNGRWFGVIMKLKNTVNPAPIQDKMSQFQADPDNKNFFLFEESGEMGAWEDGLVKNKPTSLVKSAKEGAALSYTWFDRYLLISTNLAGAEKAARNLGF